jgi:cell wall-associated NlpC family hydrolase
MSISAVEGRISQIMAMQQQLSDPAPLAASQNSTDPSAIAGTTGGASAAPASFSDALSSAMASGTASAIGTDPSTGAAGDMYSDPTMNVSLMNGNSTSGALSALLGTSGASGAAGTSAAATIGTSANAPAQVQAMVNTANSLVGKPYVYGGGHGGWAPQAGYDCSGFVSAVLHAGGYLSQPVDTTALPQQPGMEPGPGQYVTVYDRALPGENGHVIIEIGGQFYESGGSHGAWGGGGGVEKIGTPSAAYLATFPNVLHPAGL